MSLGTFIARAVGYGLVLLLSFIIILGACGTLNSTVTSLKPASLRAFIVSEAYSSGLEVVKIILLPFFCFSSKYFTAAEITLGGLL